VQRLYTGWSHSYTSPKTGMEISGAIVWYFISPKKKEEEPP
jgi:hypothetical protein